MALIFEIEIRCDLFTVSAGSFAAGAQSERVEKREPLGETIDRLRAVHGPAATSYGPKAKFPGGYLGAKMYSAEYQICRILVKRTLTTVQRSSIPLYCGFTFRSFLN